MTDDERHYQSLFEQGHDPIVIFEPEGEVVLEVNECACRVYGFDRSEFVGMSLEVISKDVERGRDCIQKTLNSNEFQRFETIQYRADGSELILSVSASTISYKGRRVILTVNRDVTLQKRAEAELQKAKRLESVGLLAGGVAHDLNNILGPLVGYSELILRKLPPDSPLRRQIDAMAKSAQSAVDVIQDLLTLARRGRYELVPMDLNEVITDYLESPGFRKIVEDTPGVSVEKRLESSPPLIKGSAAHLGKVLMKLVLNAIESMSDGGTLTIETSCYEGGRLISGYDAITPGPYLVLKVRDTGCGISAEELDRIFEPYYSTKRMQGLSGSGLGLSVVYGVVKDHDGYYDILSQEDAGTEFILYFPVTKEARPEPKSPSNCAGGHETVLVVDDDKAQREMAKDILGGLGYQVSLARNGREAVASLKSQPVDLVVLDMIMEEGFDGLDTYRQIVADRPGQKAIIVSGFSASERVGESQRLGAGAYLKKPYDIQSIAAAVRLELDKVTASATI
ncbi:MAG: response regulator [candidate division Zixibacteria bacterium]|nr:response regulator [candidate division Zixibacteria bacterium]MDH3937055.1 response regulator [candidate division Zixibacteria bacterium]MDH4032542.1 response regulator [candidate division Zixibacteria bacterium]